MKNTRRFAKSYDGEIRTGASAGCCSLARFILQKCFRFSVEREASKNIEENERECFKDAIVSSRSLNKGFVEPTNLKNAVREVPPILSILNERLLCFLALVISSDAYLAKSLSSRDSSLKEIPFF